MRGTAKARPPTSSQPPQTLPGLLAATRLRNMAPPPLEVRSPGILPPPAVRPDAQPVQTADASAMPVAAPPLPPVGPVPGEEMVAPAPAVSWLIQFLCISKQFDEVTQLMQTVDANN